MKRAIAGILMAVVMVLSIPAISSADYVNYISYDGVYQIYYTSAYRTNGAGGQMNIEWNNVPTWAYCVDLRNYINDSDTQSFYGGVGAPISPIDFKEAAWLLETSRGLADTNVKKAALQAAIWEVVDTSFALASGNSAEFIAAYDLYMGKLSDPDFNTFDPSSYVYLDLGYKLGNCDDVQDLITRVPEPGTLLLMGLGLIGLAGLRRKA